MTKPITAQTTPVYCAPNSAMEVLQRFLKCAAGLGGVLHDDPLAPVRELVESLAGRKITGNAFAVSVRNEGYNDIFDYYWCHVDRKKIAFKVYEKASKDNNNKMVFTSRETGATLTVHEKTWN